MGIAVEAVKIIAVRMLAVLPFALILGLVPTACEPERRTAPTATVPSDLREADAAWEKTYGRMSDDEKLKAVVLEPVEE